MGGAAFVAEGETETLLDAREVSPGFLDRLLGRTRTAGPRWEQFGTKRLAHLPDVAALDEVPRAFQRYIERRFLDPDPAQRAVRDYLRAGPARAALTAEEDEDGERRIFFQVGFSGCAGLAEVTAQVCAHWYGFYWQDPLSEPLRADLATCGFVPGPAMARDTPERFFPLHGGHGYAQWIDGSDWNPAYRPHKDQHTWLEVDAALDEQLPDVAARLAETYLAAVEAGVEQQCRCPFCSPDFVRRDEARL